MITPLEVQNKDFAKALNGYNKHEVDEFMVEVSRGLEMALIEEENSKKRLKDLEGQLEKFLSIETSLKGALVIAEETSREVKRNADEKAKLVILDAEINAKKIIDDANNEAIEVRHRIQELNKEYIGFKMKFKAMVSAQLETIDKMAIDE